MLKSKAAAIQAQAARKVADDTEAMRQQLDRIEAKLDAILERQAEPTESATRQAPRKGS